MWTPDVRTLFLILFLVNAILTLMLFTFWKTQKTHYGFSTWMLSLLVISCGYFLYMLRGSVSDFLSIIIANILIALSVIMRVESGRRYFWSKPISPLFYCILIPFAALFLYYTYSVDSVLLRSLISNMIIVPCLIITGILAIRSQDPENRWLMSGFAASFMVVAILLTVRTISWLITPQNQSLFSTDPVNSFSFVVTIITDILGTGFFIMLNMTRSPTDLRVSEDKFRQLFTRMPSAVAIFDAVDGGKDFIFKDFNAAAEKIEGIKKDDLIGKRVTQVFPGVKDFGILDVFCRVWRTGQHEFFPSAIYRDGHDPGTWRESWVYKLGSGEVVAIYDDITERKRAEQELVSAQESLNEAHRLAHIGTWDWVIKNDTVTWSEELYNITGRDPSLPAPTYAEHPRVYTPASWDLLNNAVTRALTSGESYNLELEIIHPNGSIRWTHAFGGVKRDGDGKVIGLHGTLQDITDRKLAEEALRESKETFKALAENANDGILVAVAGGVTTYANRRAGEITGYRSAELLKTGIKDLAAPDELEKITERFRKRLSGEDVSAQYETAIIRKDGKHVQIELSAAKTSWHGQPADLVIFRDITERKRAEERIRWLASFPEMNPNPVIEMDAQGTITFANAAALTTLRDLGLPEDPALFVPENKEEILRLLRETGESRVNREIILNNKTFAEDIALNHELRVVRFYIQNITNRKVAEEALEKSVQLLNDTGEMAKVGGWELDLSTNEVSWTGEVGRIHGVGPGYKPKLEEALNFYAPESRPAVEAAVKKTAETGEPYDLESLFIPSGSKDKIWVRLIGKAVYSDGKIVKLAGTFQNIDKYKMAEETLRETNEYLHKLIDYANAPIIIWDPAFRITRFNEAFENLTGLTEQEVIGQKIEILFPAECREASLALIKETLEGGRWESVRIPVIAADGTTHTLLWNSANILSEGAELVSTIAQGVDITLGERAEKALRASENRYRSVVEDQTEFICRFTPDGTLTFVNSAYCRYFDLRAEECIGKRHTVVLLPDDVSLMKIHFRSLTRENPVATLRHRIIMPSGEVRWQRWSDRAIFDKDGHVIEYQSVGRDITDVIKAEERLRESEEHYRLIADNTADNIWIFDMDMHMQYTSPSVEKMKGFTVKETLSMSLGEMMTPESLESVMKRFHQELELEAWGTADPGRTISFETEEYCKSGRTILVENSVTLLRDTQGSPVGMLGISHDITERKRAEDELLKSEERFQQAINATKDGLWEWDIKTNREFFSPRWCEIIGYSFDDPEFSHTYNSWASRIHPDDYDRVISALNNHLEKGTKYDVDYRHRHKSGEYRWQNSVGLAVFDESRKPTKMTGCISDITERKAAEEAIRSALEEKEVLHQEIHHRVKNNLAGIISLIELQIGSLSDPVNISHLKDLEIRVRSMALVHESLYQTKDIEWVNIATYTENLVRYLVQVYGTATDIRYKTDIEDFMIPLKTAIPCGLVMSEIVTNALKYAFPKTFSCEEIRGEPCTITIALKRKGNDYLLKISDNGIGIPEGIAITASRTLGLFLIRLIVKHQLRGTLETSTAGGTAYTIRFPEPAGKERHTDEKVPHPRS